MKINLLLNQANRSWIIQKIAERLSDQLSDLEVDCAVTESVDTTADLIHHMSWAFANIQARQPSTMFITHLDDAYKIAQVRTTLETCVNVGICMSSETMRLLLSHGCPSRSVYFIRPAHDGLIKPRRIAIGITSRIYSDGRKREALLVEVANLMDLSPFTFRIFGKGWEQTIAALEAAGALVEYFGETDDFRKDYEVLQSSIPLFDYYLYLGLDEGSLGTLDALAAGVPTIVTPQGFHLDLSGGITHPVVTADELMSVLAGLAQARDMRVASVSELTWATYARAHVALWNSILNGLDSPTLAMPTMPEPSKQLASLRRRNSISNVLSPSRLLSAISHWPRIRGLRHAIDRARFRK